MNADYDRISRAIQYVETNFRGQPTLAEIAASVGLSEFHFQRLFTRWVGISPKRFLQYQTVEHAKRLLRESRSVLEVSYEAGLSGGGRLHDLFVNAEAVTPGEFKSAGAGLAIAYGFHDTPFGECIIAATERGICALNFVGDGGRAAASSELRHRWSCAELRRDEGETADYAESVFAVLDAPEGGTVPPLAIHLKGTNFQLKVWQALLRIPPGFVVSYEDVAEAVGNPRAVRAVGTAVGQNPISYLIPCHRVIRKSGALGNYGGGTPRKRAMLGWEAARIEAVSARLAG